MHVNLSISLGPDDPVPSLSPAEALSALGGDPTKDSINVTVSASSAPPPPEGVPVPGGPTP